MSEFESPAYIKPTDPTGDVLVFGKSPELEAGDAIDGIARFGGLWRRPRYHVAYMKSARILIDHGRQNQCLDDVALPAFYMQRHALELLIKSWLTLIYEYAAFEKELGRATGGVPSPSQLKASKKSHNLGLLLGNLRSASGHFDFGDPPSETIALVEALQTFERTETWARYASSEDKNGTKTNHVEDEVEIPMAKMQCDLEALYAKAAYSPDDDSRYEGILYHAWYAAAYPAGAVA